MAVYYAVLLLIIQPSKYTEADVYYNLGKHTQAALCFDEAGSYKDAQYRCLETWQELGKTRSWETISATYLHAVGLKSDGTVVAVGEIDEELCGIGNWADIKAYSK